MIDPAAAKTQGFTLLEMLIAMAVLSIAALALVRLDAVAVQTTDHLSRSAIAHIVAANVAVDLLSAPAAPAIGTSAFSARNGGLDWTVTQAVAATADPALLRVDIRVTGSSVSPATLTIIREASQ